MAGNVIFGLFIVILVCTTTQTSLSFKALPNKLHCLARVSFANEGHNSTDLLRVEEYVDIEARRSSISIHDIEQDTTEIHYNKLHSNDLGGRKSVVFRPDQLSCDSQRISEWQFADLRRVSIHLHKVIDLDREKYIDVPIGPSVLAYATHTNVRQFKFVKTVISKTLVSNVNVYRLMIDYNPLNSIFRRVLVELHVSTAGQRRGLKPNDTLASALLDNSYLDIKFLGACQLEKRNGLSANKPQESDKQNLNTNEDVFCLPDPGQKLLFEIHYDILEEYKPGSLVRKLRNDFKPNKYDYSENPLMQPVGIGCWDLGVNLSWRSKLVEDDPSRVSMSASYVTNFGPRGLSYVAYDGLARLVRLDWKGRKNIYNLMSFKSYHLCEFSLSSEHQTSMIENQMNSEKCIVFDMDDKLSSIKAGPSAVEQLLGLGSTELHHLGTQTVEHDQYEVYEQLVDDIDHVPVLLQRKLDRYRKDELGKIYLTYYIQNDNLIHMIEVHDFRHNQSYLINRLIFVDFSWSLEVEPTDDPLSQTSDSNLRLFELEPCLLNRATQAPLVVGFKLDPDGEQISQINTDQLVKAFKHNKQKLTADIHRLLANRLKLSKMNIVDLKLGVAPRADRFLATGRIVDLQSSLSRAKFLGNLFRFDRIMDANKIHEYESRHSLEECYLDSIELDSMKNLIAYCPSYTSCVILKRDQTVISKIEQVGETREKWIGTDSERGLCDVYDLKYSSIESTMRSLSALDQIDTYLPYIDKELFKFRIERYKDADDLQPGFELLARADVKSYLPLDTIANPSTSTSFTALSGLRYSTMDEEPAAKNLNMRVSLVNNKSATRNKSSTFTHCQLSCQIDEFCGSFSVCSGSHGALIHDCILSTLRLSSERVAKIVSEASRVKANETKFQVDFMTLSNEKDLKLQQQFIMHKGEACSLHPRDFMSDHKLMRSVTHLIDHQSDEDKVHKESILETLYQNGHRMSLDDCAGLSFEKNFGCASMRNTNFTYCPLESLCFVNYDDDIEQLNHIEGPCLKYQRQATKAYKSVGSLKMELTPLSSKSDHDARQVTLEDQKADEGSISPIKTFLGLSEEDCARNCGFHKSDCLAFDSCRNNGAIECRLHHVRSPLSKSGAYLQLLKHEQEITQQYKIELTTSPTCEHFYPRPFYFEVRLKNLLARQLDKRSEHSVELERLEEKIETDYEETDKHVYQLLTEQSTKEARPSTKQVSQSWISWTELLIGLMIGCVVILVKEQITDVVALANRRMRRDSATHNLVIEDNL